MKTETFKIYEKLPIPHEKCFLGERTGIFINDGKQPGFFKESITGIIYPMWNYEFIK